MGEGAIFLFQYIFQMIGVVSVVIIRSTLVGGRAATITTMAARICHKVRRRHSFTNSLEKRGLLPPNALGIRSETIGVCAEQECSPKTSYIHGRTYYGTLCRRRGRGRRREPSVTCPFEFNFPNKSSYRGRWEPSSLSHCSLRCCPVLCCAVPVDLDCVPNLCYPNF